MTINGCCHITVIFGSKQQLLASNMTAVRNHHDFLQTGPLTLIQQREKQLVLSGSSLNVEN